MDGSRLPTAPASPARLVHVVIAGALLGCGASHGATDADDDVPSPIVPHFTGALDGGTRPIELPAIEDVRFVVPEEPNPPVRVAAPNLRPCPTGWAESGDACEPFPNDEGSCARGEARFPGDPACRPIGSACPDGVFPTVDGPAVYVLEGANGRGTRDDPYPSIDAALGDAPDATTIVVGKGMYPTSARIDRDVTLIGACARETLVVSRSADAGAVFEITAGRALIRDISIRGSLGPGISVSGEATNVTLRSVLIGGASGFGIRQIGGWVELDRVMVRDIAPSDPSVGLGRGVHVESGTFHASRLIVQRAREAGLVAAHEARVVLDHTLIVDTKSSQSGGLAGFGIDIRDGSRVTLRRTIIDACETVGVSVAGSESNLEAIDIVVRSTRSRASDGTAGSALEVRDGAEANVVRAHFDESQESGISVLSNGSLTLRDALVTRTRPRNADRRYGRGINVGLGAEVSLERVRIERARDVGLLASGGAKVEARDLVIRDVSIDLGAERGADGIRMESGAIGSFERVEVFAFAERGVAVSESEVDFTDLSIHDAIPDEVLVGTVMGMTAIEGAQVSLTRGSISAVSGVGVNVRGARLESADLVIREVEPDSLGLSGKGLLVSDGGTVTGERILVTRAHEAAVVVDGDSTIVKLAELRVAGTESRAADGQRGFGLVAQNRAGLLVENGLVEDNRGIGVVAMDESQAMLADVQVRATRCTQVSCPGMDGTSSTAPGGVAVATYRGGRVAIDGFQLDGPSFCGVHLAEGGKTELRNGIIRGHAIGACVEWTGYPMGSIGRTVTFEDNGLERDARLLPVVEPFTIVR